MVLFILACFLILSILSVGAMRTVAAHEEGEAPWLPVHQVEGNLIVRPDPSLLQWSEAHHAHAVALDGPETELMSVHNGTFWVLLAERPFNTSIANAGMSLFLNGTIVGGSDEIWGWVGGQNNSTDPNVVSQGTLENGELDVVFGRSLTPSTGTRFGIGVAYDGALKVTSWNNGTAATVLSYDGIDSMGLELLPHLDIFPRTPFVYGLVLLAATAAFIMLEFRRYRP